jgi:hypothetical protein
MIVIDKSKTLSDKKIKEIRANLRAVNKLEIIEENVIDYKKRADKELKIKEEVWSKNESA